MWEQDECNKTTSGGNPLTLDASSHSSVSCQTEPNLIDKLIACNNTNRLTLDEADLYKEYVRSAQCSQFWPLDKNPIRSLVPSMVKVDLPEQYLKNESLMFDLVQAITSDSKLVNLLAKYIHHIVPNVIISKRVDLIPLIICTIRVCKDTSEQERLMALLFNLIKRPNEEQRRMILSGIIVVLQVSPHQSSSLLLPNLWDHVGDKFPERRILLAESCASLAHYVRPVMRTNLILSILIQLLKDKNVAVRSTASKSFACLLTLIMDRNDEVFDAVASATEDIIQDTLQATPLDYCEHRHEFEQMRHCALETVYPLIAMWAVKLSRFKVEVAEFYVDKAEKYFKAVKLRQNSLLPSPEATATNLDKRRKSVFVRQFGGGGGGSGGVSSVGQSQSSAINPEFELNNETNQVSFARRQSAYPKAPFELDPSCSSLTAQRAVGAYLKMLNYLIPFVFSDAVNSCAWLSRSSLHLTSDDCNPNESISVYDPNNNNVAATILETTVDSPTITSEAADQIVAKQTTTSFALVQKAHDPTSNLTKLFDKPLKFANELLNPVLICDESAIGAFHDQFRQSADGGHKLIDSLDWVFDKFLPKFFNLVANFSSQRFCTAIGVTSEQSVDFLTVTILSTSQMCLLFGKHLTRAKIRPLIEKQMNEKCGSNLVPFFASYLASLTAFEPIEQVEFEEIVASLRQCLCSPSLTRFDVEVIGISIKVITTNAEHIHSPSTRQKFLTYILDVLIHYSNNTINHKHNLPTLSSSSQLQSQRGQLTKQSSSSDSCESTARAGDFVQKLSAKERIAAVVRNHSKIGTNRADQHQQAQTKEFMLILFKFILTCLVDPAVRPPDWSSLLISKFLPLLISLANDSTNVYVCTYARLMCAQLVETFDTYLNSPNLTQRTAEAMLPALKSLQSLTEQIKASNLKRQIDSLLKDLNEKFYPTQQQQ